jgi:mRNA interferase MazF
MRPIRLARLDKTRPVVVLTREAMWPHLHNLTVAPITSTVRGLSTEVLVGPGNGLDRDSAISCDNVTTVPAEALGRVVGYLDSNQEQELARAIITAYDLAVWIRS